VSSLCAPKRDDAALRFSKPERRSWAETEPRSRSSLMNCSRLNAFCSRCKNQARKPRADREKGRERCENRKEKASEKTEGMKGIGKRPRTRRPRKRVGECLRNRGITLVVCYDCCPKRVVLSRKPTIEGSTAPGGELAPAQHREPRLGQTSPVGALGGAYSGIRRPGGVIRRWEVWVMKSGFGVLLHIAQHVSKRHLLRTAGVAQLAPTNPSRKGNEGACCRQRAGLVRGQLRRNCTFCDRSRAQAQHVRQQNRSQNESG